MTRYTSGLHIPCCCNKSLRASYGELRGQVLTLTFDLYRQLSTRHIKTGLRLRALKQGMKTEN